MAKKKTTHDGFGKPPKGVPGFGKGITPAKPPSGLKPPLPINKKPNTPIMGSGDTRYGGDPLPPAYDPRIEGLYNDTVGGAKTTRSLDLGDLNFAEKTGANNYGFNLGGAYNPDGTPSGNYGVDPSDPFSKMALLQKSYEDHKRGSTNSLAAQGQLHSGAMRNAQKYNTENFAQGKDALMKDFTEFLQGIIRGRRGADTNFNTTVTGAARSRLDSQLGGNF